MNGTNLGIFKTRFAPSPTGFLHLGHAYSALTAYDAAVAAGGRFLLRIEDIDQTRCRPNYTNAIFEDLEWLGLKWEVPVRVQSEHFADYRAALNKLEAMGLIYHCTCTRKEIEIEISKSAAAPHGLEGALYPGTCRPNNDEQMSLNTNAGKPYAVRLNVAKAIKLLKNDGNWPLTWVDEHEGEQIAAPEKMGDIILARKDTPTSYHLAVTVDDALEVITHIIRGVDLFEATHIHVLLQALLGYKTPHYNHHKLIIGEDGKRLAKRDAAKTIRALREEGKSPDDIRAMIGLS